MSAVFPPGDDLVSAIALRRGIILAQMFPCMKGCDHRSIAPLDGGGTIMDQLNLCREEGLIWSNLIPERGEVNMDQPYPWRAEGVTLDQQYPRKWEGLSLIHRNPGKGRCDHGPIAALERRGVIMDHPYPLKGGG